MVGYKQSSPDNGTDIYLIKTNSTGDTLWTRTYDGHNSDDEGQSVLQTNDGGYIIAGHTRHEEPFSPRQNYLIKTDSLGIQSWSRSYLLFSDLPQSSLANSVAQGEDGSFYVTGMVNVTGPMYDWCFGWTLKTDPDGDSLWVAFAGDVGYSVCATMDGGCIITGGFTIDEPYQNFIFYSKYNAMGERLWGNSFTGIKGTSIRQMKDGNYILSGLWYVEDIPSLCLIKLDAMGDTLWTRTYGGPHSVQGESVRQTADGGYVVGGWTVAEGENYGDFYLLKVVDPPTKIEDSEDIVHLPITYDLSQNYPNPFNPSTTIDCTVQDGVKTKSCLTVFNVRGKKVRTLVNKVLAPGKHSFIWDGSDDLGNFVPSGVYLYHFESGGYRATRKLLLLN